MSKEIESHILNHFEIKQFIGSGAYGHVWKVVDKQTEKEYALKKIFDAFQNDIDAQRTYREVTILHQLDHVNIIKLESVIKAHNGKDLYLLFEFMETDLHSIIGENILGAIHIRFVAYQICKVLKYLHSAQLIHRDLKSSNILINSNCEIKLCDFGLVRSLTYEEDSCLVLSEDVATRWYRSPQMLLGCRNYGPATDMWSLGCVLAELVIGEPLFPGSSSLDQFQKILQFTGLPSNQTFQKLGIEFGSSFASELDVKQKPAKEFLGSCDSEIRQMILKLLEFDPSKRLTADEALQLPCLQEFRGKSREDICKRYITIDLDDNKRLDLEEYKKAIYKDIERRYPEHNKITPMPRIYRSHYSLNAKTHAEESLIKKGSNSLFKNHNSIHFFQKNCSQSAYLAESPLHRLLALQKSRFGLNGDKENVNMTMGCAVVEKELSGAKIFKRKARNIVWKKRLD